MTWVPEEPFKIIRNVGVRATDLTGPEEAARPPARLWSSPHPMKSPAADASRAGSLLHTERSSAAPTAQAASSSLCRRRPSVLLTVAMASRAGGLSWNEGCPYVLCLRPLLWGSYRHSEEEEERPPSELTSTQEGRPRKSET